MASKCTTCGADDATAHVCAGDLEQTYQRDLRNLAARTRETLAPPPTKDAVSLDAPASVREAIRLTDTLIPLAPPEPAPPSAAKPDVLPAPARRRRLALAAIVLGGALTGSLLWQVERGAAPPPQAAMPVVDALRFPKTPAPEPLAPIVATSFQTRVEPPPRTVSSARRPLAIVSKPRPVKPLASSAAPTASAAPSSPPSLMEAIVSSVVSRGQHADSPPAP